MLGNLIFLDLFRIYVASIVNSLIFFYVVTCAFISIPKIGVILVYLRLFIMYVQFIIEKYLEVEPVTTDATPVWDYV
jgi:hypothetical protein